MSYPQHLSATEREIIDRIVKKALSLNNAITIFDGEGNPCKKSQDYEAITKNVAQTDMTIMTFYDASLNILGSMMFIHGNDEDVIGDHTDSPYFHELFEIGIGSR